MTRSDIPAAAAIVAAHDLWQRYGVDLARAVAMFENALIQGDHVVVATSESLEGVAWAQPRGAFGRAPYLRLIAARPGATGLGIGRLLLEDFEAFAGADAFLLVSDFNEGARRFYAREGWAEVGRLESFVLEGVTEILLRKRRVRAPG